MVYKYECGCGWAGDKMFIPYDDRNKQKCPECSKELGVPIPAFSAVGAEPYQMKAILSDGSTVKGHFGREAKRSKK